MGQRRARDTPRFDHDILFIQGWRDLLAQTGEKDDARAKLLERARRVVDGCGERLGEAETARLRQRVATLERRLGG